MTRAFLIRGLWGWLYSRGMDELADKLRRIGVEAEVWGKGFVGYWNLRRITAEAVYAYARGEKIVLIGHSMGADEAVMVARELWLRGIPVELLVCIDPTRFGLPKMPSNVKRAMCFSGNDGGLGDGVLVAENSADADKIVVQYVSTVHIKLDNDPRIHQSVLAALA